MSLALQVVYVVLMPVVEVHGEKAAVVEFASSNDLGQQSVCEKKVVVKLTKRRF